MLAILSVVAALFSGQMLAQNITSSLPAVNKAVTAGPGFNDTMPCNPYASSGPDNTTGGFAINPVVMAGPSGKSSYTTGLASYGTGTSSQPLYIKYFGSKGQTDNGVVFTGPVTVYAIYYGGGEATDKALSVMEDFITWFGTSQYWKTITQNFYQINWDGSKSYPGTLTKAAFNSHLNVAGKYLNNMGRGNSNVTYNMLQDEFAGWITNGSVTTNNGIYSYFLDSNVMISDNQGNAILNSGSNTLAMYCGIHNFFSIGGKAYFYTIAPKFTDTLYGSQFTCMRRASAVVGIPNATS